jgi:hypothetical protein
MSHGKMIQHGTGMGTVTREMVQKRARELAISDGRSADEVTQADFAQARRELIGAGMSNNDDLDEAASTSNWDPAPGTIGRRAESQEVDDEETIAEHLMHEGIEEADHDERVESGRESRRESGE